MICQSMHRIRVIMKGVKHMHQIERPILYFAYGLSLNPQQMQLKCSNFEKVGIARLPGYRMDFFEYSPVWDGAMETIVPDEQSEVWGILYRLTDYSWDELDNCEDARLDGTGAYFRSPVDVYGTDGITRLAMLYLKSRLGKPAFVSSEYMVQVLLGAVEQGLPAPYIEKLQAIATKPASYLVPRRPAYERGSCNSRGCEACGADCDGSTERK
ncbi:MAG: AIG2-like family protein [Firmicutes bacterium]|nr:AIG2-like family protein [Bacillota bacterium]